MSTIVVIPIELVKNSVFNGQVSVKAAFITKKLTSIIIAEGAYKDVTDVDQLNANFLDACKKNGGKIPEVFDLRVEAQSPITTHYIIANWINKISSAMLGADASEKLIYKKLISGLCASEPAKELISLTTETITQFSSKSGLSTEEVNAVVQLLKGSTLLLSYVLFNFKRGEMFNVYSGIGEQQLLKMAMKKDDLLDKITTASKMSNAGDVKKFNDMLTKLTRQMSFLKGDLAQRIAAEQKAKALWVISTKATFANCEAALGLIQTDEKADAMSSSPAENWKGNGRICTMSGKALEVFLLKYGSEAKMQDFLVPESDLIKLFKQLNNESKVKLAGLVTAMKGAIKAKRDANASLTDLINKKAVTVELASWYTFCSIWQEKRNAVLSGVQRSTVSKKMTFTEVNGEILSSGFLTF